MIIFYYMYRLRVNLGFIIMWKVFAENNLQRLTISVWFGMIKNGIWPNQKYKCRFKHLFYTCLWFSIKYNRMIYHLKYWIFYWIYFVWSYIICLWMSVFISCFNPAQFHVIFSTIHYSNNNVYMISSAVLPCRKLTGSLSSFDWHIVRSTCVSYFSADMHVTLMQAF